MDTARSGAVGRFNQRAPGIERPLVMTPETPLATHDSIKGIARPDVFAGSRPTHNSIQNIARRDALDSSQRTRFNKRHRPTRRTRWLYSLPCQGDPP
jgi:hypothetical protein